MDVFISVILPVYNQQKFVAETIESVLSQSFRHFELLIADDGSTDDSSGIIRNHAEKDSRIKAFYWQNKGRAETANELVKIARGTYCVMMDADDIMLPERIERQVRYLEQNANVCACSCNSYYIDERGEICGKLSYPFLKTIEASRQTFQDKQQVICSFTGLTIRTDVFLANGGLSYKYWPADDFEFVNRLIADQFIVVVLQDVLMKYRVHRNSVSSYNTFFIYLKGMYVRVCLQCRQQHLPEPDFENYLAEKNAEPQWKKTRLRRHIRSIGLFQQAGFAKYKKKYIRFVALAFVASCLSPAFLLSKLRK